MEVSTQNRPFVIHWRDAFKINLPEVDAEHRHLFALVAQLERATIGATIDELLNYVATHFTHEQQLMEQSGYPGFEEHLKLHEQFSMAVADFLGSGGAWNDERVEELRKFLNRWLVGHIMTHDLRFGNWYRDHRTGERPPAAAGSRRPPQARAATPHRGWFGRLFGRG